MKIKLILTVATILAIGAFSSCKKKTEAVAAAVVTPTPDPTPTPLVESFTATVDGVVFNENLYSSGVTNGKLLISAAKSAGVPSIGISVPTNIAVGTYVLTNAFGTYGGTYNIANAVSGQFAANNGTLTITAHNTTAKQITGTFSFNATASLGNTSSSTFSITAGSFAKNY